MTKSKTKATTAAKTAGKPAKPKAAPKPKIKTVEETTAGPVEVAPTPEQAVVKKAMATSGEPKKLSALDAAAQVLSQVKEPLTSKQLIEAMAAQGLWTSPGGKTPQATLYSAILREINTKGVEARFAKAERGKFVLQA